MSSSNVVGGIGSSRWNTRPVLVPNPQTQNTAFGLASNNRSVVPPHLRSNQANSQNAITDTTRASGSKPVSIPPHLRGFNNQGGQATFTATKSVPISGTLDDATLVPVKDIVNNSAQQSIQPITPSRDSQITAPSFADVQKRATPPHLRSERTQASAALTKTKDKSTQDEIQPLLGKHTPLGTSNDEKKIVPPAQSAPAEKSGGKVDFLQYMNLKLLAKAEAKKKEIKAKGEVLTLAEDRKIRYNLFPVPNSQGDAALKNFLESKEPVSNGKKYTFTDGQQIQGSLPVTKKESEYHQPSLQTPQSARMMETSPLGTFGASTPLSSWGEGKTDKSVKFENVASDFLVEPGFEPASSSLTFDDKISDFGVGQNKKENVRATQGEDPRSQFIDWDGKTRAPVPVDWENDRGTFDRGFIPEYISQDWEPSVPHGRAVIIDTKDPKFELAVPIGAEGFHAPLEHPDTTPGQFNTLCHAEGDRLSEDGDLQDSENLTRQLNNTANIVTRSYLKDGQKSRKPSKAQALSQKVNQQDCELQPAPLQEDDPYKPKIDLYLRPACETDAKGIAEIYNYYVLHSLATEDQIKVGEAEIAFLIQNTRSDQLPIIVAVKGKMPVPSPGKLSSSKKVLLPQYENIIGFGYAETYNYGIGGSATGRSRFTATIQFYVHHEQTRKRVGQSLLDRLIQSLSHGYGAKNGYDWMDPNEDPVYKDGGVRKVHRLIIQFAVQAKVDPTYEWMKNFLRRYFFQEEGRISRIARSQAAGPGAKFADMVIFSKEVAGEKEFGAMI